MVGGRAIRVIILDDHQSIVDGYILRLSTVPDIKVVGTASYGEELEPLLAANPADVLLLDVQVPTAPDNHNPYPIFQLIPRLLQVHPSLDIVVISMYSQRTLIKAVMDSGASGYILKEDAATIRQLGTIVQAVAEGGIYLSQRAYQELSKRRADAGELTNRQCEVLSLCGAYPDWTTAQLAQKLGVANSTVRNLLSDAYLRLGVRSRAAAVAEAQRRELITPPAMALDVQNIGGSPGRLS